MNQNLVSSLQDVSLSCISKTVVFSLQDVRVTSAVNGRSKAAVKKEEEEEEEENGYDDYEEDFEVHVL